MSGNITRISLDTALEGDRTDWSRIRDQPDAEIDAAMATDPDSVGLSPRRPTGAFYQIYQDPAREWRWRLIAGDHGIVAEGAGGYASRDAVERALVALQSAVATAEVKAA